LEIKQAEVAANKNKEELGTRVAQLEKQVAELAKVNRCFSDLL
jgi:hypothetical protein